MAYEGKYLRAEAQTGRGAKPAKKKGRIRPWMIVIAVILALVIGIGAAGYTYYKSMLGNVKRAEYEDKNQDLSIEDALKLISGNNGSGESAEEETPEEAQEEK